MRSAFAGWPRPTPGTSKAGRRSISTTSAPRWANAVAAVSPPTPPPTTSTRRILFMAALLTVAHGKLRLFHERVSRVDLGRHLRNRSQIALAGEHDAAIAGVQRCDEFPHCAVEICERSSDERGDGIPALGHRFQCNPRCDASARDRERQPRRQIAFHDYCDRLLSRDQY